jgi:hypothetical protein
VSSFVPVNVRSSLMFTVRTAFGITFSSKQILASIVLSKGAECNVLQRIDGGLWK